MELNLQRNSLWNPGFRVRCVDAYQPWIIPKPTRNLPTKLFKLVSMLFKEVRLAKDLGNDEVKLLQQILRMDRLIKSWMLSETMPLSFMFDKSSYLTRPFKLPEIPVQLKCLSVEFFQPLRRSKGSIKLDFIDNADNSAFGRNESPLAEPKEKPMKQ